MYSNECGMARDQRVKSWFVDLASSTPQRPSIAQHDDLGPESLASTDLFQAGVLGVYKDLFSLEKSIFIISPATHILPLL